MANEIWIGLGRGEREAAFAIYVRARETAVASDERERSFSLIADMPKAMREKK